MKFFIICTLVCLLTLNSRCLTSGKPLVANELKAAEAEDGTEPSEKDMPLINATDHEIDHSKVGTGISRDNIRLELVDENDHPLSTVPNTSHAVSNVDQTLDGFSQETNKEPLYENKFKDLNSVSELDEDHFGQYAYQYMKNADLFPEYDDQYGQNADKFGQYDDQYGKNADLFGQYAYQYGKNADLFGQYDDQYGRNADQFGQYAYQYGKNADLFGQYADQYGKKADQFGQYAYQYGKSSDLFGQYDDQYGRNADLFIQNDQSEQNANQFAQYTDLVGQNAEQFEPFIDLRK